MACRCRLMLIEDRERVIGRPAQPARHSTRVRPELTTVFHTHSCVARTKSGTVQDEVRPGGRCNLTHGLEQAELAMAETQCAVARPGRLSY